MIYRRNIKTYCLRQKDEKVFAEWLDEEGIFHIVETIQIPNPHGDLIDRNQVFTYSHRDVKNLEEVPVILEGEEW